MADSSISNSRPRPRPTSDPFVGSPRRTTNSGGGSGSGPKRNSEPPPTLSRDSSTVFTLPSRPQRPRTSRIPAALDTIHEAPQRNRFSDSTLAEKDVGLGYNEKSGFQDYSPGPAVPPAMYNGDGRLDYDNQAHDSAPRYSQIYNQTPQFPHGRQPTDLYNLPYYYNQGRRPPKKSLVERASEFFHRISEDQDIPSLPPSRTPSVHIGSGAQAQSEKRMQTTGQGGRPAFGNGIQNGPANPAENDMFLQAMRINGDLEVRDALAVDADVQLYPQPQPDKLTEIPNFLQNRLHHSDHPGNTEGQRSQVPQAGKERKGHHRIDSYRQRRKKPKHKIVYNIDSPVNQQLFILVLAKALLVFGAPSHRIEPQLASVAAIFELPAQFSHTPGCVQVSFGLPEQHASEVLLIKASVGLDLGRIHETHAVYRAVVRDEISASEGRVRLKAIIDKPPLYSAKLITILSFFQGFILCGSSFGGSLNDMWVSGVLSTLVFIAQQKAARSELSASGADIFISAVVSLVARALSLKVPGRIFCYQAISSTSVAGLLPGSIMLQGVLDIASKNIYLGSSKVVAGLMTSLYLGFGLTLGSDVWLHFDQAGRNYIAATADKFETFNGTFFSANASTPAWLSPTNLTGIWAFQEELSTSDDNIVNGCYRNPHWPWPLRKLPFWTLFILLPVLNLILSIKRNQPVKSVQMPVMILISCCSFAVTQVANLKMGFQGHPDYTALLGSFVVSLLGNLYSRRFGGTAFTIMLTGIWLLIPTGLAEAGGLSSSYIAPGEDEYTEALELARKMISVIIGVMSGVYLSARFIYTFGKKKNSAFVTF